MVAENMLRKVDIDWLLEVYGAILTDKQRDIAALYYEEDLSLAEIAQQENVSRQSVHETLQRVEKQLRMLEDKLGFRNRLIRVEHSLEEALSALSAGKEPETKQHIEQAIRLLNDEEESNGL